MLDQEERTHGWAGRVAVVTGGSRGIGRAIAMGFAARGAQVIICGRTAESLAEAASAVQAAGGTCETVVADVSRAEDLERLMRLVEDRGGRLDFLVNNAVTSTSARFAELSDDDFRYHIDVKLMAYIRLARLALPLMAKRGRGRIVNIGGMSARVTAPLRLTNGVVNAGVANFTKQFATPAAEAGVTVNCVHPGFTSTERVQQIFEREATESGEDIATVVARRTQDIPMRRLVQPADIAMAVLFFCEDAANMITGQCIAVDGGSGTSISY